MVAGDTAPEVAGRLGVSHAWICALRKGARLTLSTTGDGGRADFEKYVNRKIGQPTSDWMMCSTA